MTCKTGSQPNQDWFENGAPSGNSSGSSSGSSSGGCTYTGVVAPCIGSTTTGEWVVEGPRQPNNCQEYACYSPGSVSVSGGCLNLALQNTSCSVGGRHLPIHGRPDSYIWSFQPDLRLLRSPRLLSRFERDRTSSHREGHWFDPGSLISSVPDQRMC